MILPLTQTSGSDVKTCLGKRLYAKTRHVHEDSGAMALIEKLVAASCFTLFGKSMGHYLENHPEILDASDSRFLLIKYA